MITARPITSGPSYAAEASKPYRWRGIPGWNPAAVLIGPASKGGRPAMRHLRRLRPPQAPQGNHLRTLPPGTQREPARAARTRSSRMNPIRRILSRIRGHQTGHRKDPRSVRFVAEVHAEAVARAALGEEAERRAAAWPHLRFHPLDERVMRPGCDPVMPCGIRFDNDADRAYETICVRHARPTGRHHRQQSDPAEPIILASVTDMAPRSSAGAREKQS